MLRAGSAVAVACVLCLAQGAQAAEGQIVLKVGTLAPKGSTWERVFAETLNDINRATNGRLKFLMYAGGVLGDEEDMVRKIRIGQLDGGGFTVLGAEEIAAETSILELPFFFDSLEQVDRLRSFMEEELGKLYASRGFVLLSLVDQAGFIQMYSKEKVASLADLKSRKPWVWAGNRVHYETYKAMGIEPNPLAVPDVLQGLQTGLINVVTTTPLACVALQWYTQINYVLKVDLRYEPGVIVLAKKTWDSLPAEYRELIMHLSKQYQPKLIDTARRDDQTALGGMRKKGIQIVLPDPALRQEMIQLTRDAVPDVLIREGIFTRAFYEKVRSRLASAAQTAN
ncbi:MAG: TRAP transporter substrate-binding protein DctP [Nitrospirae bacterium]|nr:TRAP transporter substrate-binding protein DctP [Nitrospirota bacterium]